MFKSLVRFSHVIDFTGTNVRFVCVIRDRVPDCPCVRNHTQTHIHRQSFHFDTRRHRTGVHTDETSTPLEAPGPPYNVTTAVLDHIHISTSQASFRNRGHRTGVHTGANSTPLEGGPWTPLQPYSTPSPCVPAPPPGSFCRLQCISKGCSSSPSASRWA